MLACHLGMLQTSAWNVLEGTDLSIRLNDSNLGDLVNRQELASFKSTRDFCLTADIVDILASDFVPSDLAWGDFQNC